MSMIQTFPTGSGSGSGSNNGFYKTTDTITATIDASTTLDITNITGLTMADVIINETIIYDDLGTTAKVTAIDTTNNTIDVKTITLGGTTYYYVERDGQELLSAYASLDSDWTVVVNQKIPLIKRSGSINQSSTGSFTIPNGRRIEILFSVSQAASSGTSQPDVIYGLYNDTDSAYITSRTGDLKPIDPYNITQYSHGHTLALQWVNDTGHDVNISIRPIQGTGANVRYDYTSLTIKEIGRIVDPVQYTANNEELEETPVGNIISYMGNSVPKHYLACDGATYPIGTYKELEAFIIDEFGSINYFGGNGTTTFAVPDLRGEFLRGSGTNSHANQGSGANVGVHQNGTVIPTIYGNSQYSEIGTANAAASEADYINNNINKFVASSTKGTYNNTSILGNTFTSRPTNTSVNYCIKYESTYHIIIPSHMYKVSVPFSVTHNSSDNIDWTLDSTNAKGDTSLISGNTFIVPITGWYNISHNTVQTVVSSTSPQIDIKILKNGTVISSTPLNLAQRAMALTGSETYYLEKGDIIKIQSWSNTSNTVTGTANFCLLTSNYNPTIVSADSIYSENEQMIGYWTDGKPLYQKTIITTSPSAIDTAKYISIGASIDKGFVKYGSMDDGFGNLLPLPFSTNAGFTGYIRAYIINDSASSNKNSISLYVKISTWLDKTMYFTIQYTKTTDTASSLQIENSLLLNRPDLWTPGTEYHFGGGLYGYRATGTSLNASSGTSWVNYLDKSIGLVSAPQVVSYGGAIQVVSGGSQFWTPAFQYRGGFDSNIYFATGGNIRGQLTIGTSTFTVTTACKYDVWITYKK